MESMSAGRAKTTHPHVHVALLPLSVSGGLTDLLVLLAEHAPRI
jgi:hypothetical protein